MYSGAALKQVDWRRPAGWFSDRRKRPQTEQVRPRRDAEKDEERGSLVQWADDSPK